MIALVRPLSLDDVSLRLHLAVAVASTLLLACPLAVRRRLGRFDGALSCALYVAAGSIAA